MMVRSTKCYVHKTCFPENRKDTWTYDNCAFNTGRITDNKYYMLRVIKK